ncbi:MAG: DNA-3-methyladenine glycosylase family protein [Candidatus Kariarchaeaceae archaeon]|jgi:DNA-3-methyladenine glycosylase II
MREGVPFYLKTDQPNVITPDLIERFGQDNPGLIPYLEQYPVELRRLELPPYHSFCAWITGQLVSVRVAEVFLERFEALMNPITPEGVLKLDQEQLFGIGLTRVKVAAITGLAELFVSEPDTIEQMLTDGVPSEDVITYFSQIKGIGPWTVEMFLIFNMTRLDVFSYRDLVVRKGMQILYDLPEVPSLKEARDLGQSWGELKTIGTLLSWAVMGE